MKRILRAVKRFILPYRTTKEIRHAMVGPPDLWKLKRDFQIQFLKTMKLRPEHYVLDMGCGTLRGGIPLISYLHVSHYYGVEVREEALSEGRKELCDAGLEYKRPILMHVTDISNLSIDKKFDFIWGFSVLIHMGDEILDAALGFANEHLKRDGRFYANVNLGKDEDGDWQGFPVVRRTLEFYKKACAKNGLEVKNIGALREHGHASGVEAQDTQVMLSITKTN